MDSNQPVSVSLANGQAKFSTASLGVGTHSIVATYSGSTIYASSSATLSEVVNQAGTTTTIAASGSFVVGQPLTLSSQVLVTTPGYGRPTAA